MPGSDLSELVSGKSEALNVGSKAWMDTTEPATRAKVAKHIAALANHGGGYLIFGVEDRTREPMGEPMLDRSLFSQDAIAGIVKKYLDPRLQVRVEEAEHGGIRYPVAIVPSHGARPVVAVADGPQIDGKPVGIRQGEVYVRAAGPESVPIRSPDDWNALMDRCLAHRADLMGKVVRQAIARPGRPSPTTIGFLSEVSGTTAADFSAQARTLAADVAASDRPRVQAATAAHCALACSLVDGDGEPVELESLRALAGRAAVGMRTYAYDDWALFLPLTVPVRSPQIRTEKTSDGERTYLEGMRLPSIGVLASMLDYWRLYDRGVAVSIQSYREDFIAEKIRAAPYLTVAQTLFRLHSLLTHARLVGEETPGVEQVLVRMDWRGLAGRPLMWTPQRFGRSRDGGRPVLQDARRAVGRASGPLFRGAARGRASFPRRVPQRGLAGARRVAHARGRRPRAGARRRARARTSVRRLKRPPGCPRAAPPFGSSRRLSGPATVSRRIGHSYGAYTDGAATAQHAPPCASPGSRCGWRSKSAHIRRGVKNWHEICRRIHGGQKTGRWTHVNAVSRRRRWPKASVYWGPSPSRNRPPRSVAWRHAARSSNGCSLARTDTAPDMRGFSPPPTFLSGAPFARRSAICLQGQHFTDSLNHPAFPTTVLRPGERFASRTLYRFDAS